MENTTESRLTALENWTREHESVVKRLKTDVTQVKEGMAKSSSGMHEVIIASRSKNKIQLRNQNLGVARRQLNKNL